MVGYELSLYIFNFMYFAIFKYLCILLVFMLSL